MYRDRYRAARELGKRSGLEVKIESQLNALNARFSYEPGRIPYTKPHYYLPDFILPNGIVIEAKGYFESSDRGKLKAVKAAFPGLDLRMVFSNSRTKIAKKSDTTYGMWCHSNDIPFFDSGLVPPAWIEEDDNEESIAILKELGLLK